MSETDELDMYYFPACFLVFQG